MGIVIRVAAARKGNSSHLSVAEFSCKKQKWVLYFSIRLFLLVLKNPFHYSLGKFLDKKQIHLKNIFTFLSKLPPRCYQLQIFKAKKNYANRLFNL